VLRRNLQIFQQIRRYYSESGCGKN